MIEKRNQIELALLLERPGDRSPDYELATRVFRLEPTMNRPQRVEILVGPGKGKHACRPDRCFVVRKAVDHRRVPARRDVRCEGVSPQRTEQRVVVLIVLACRRVHESDAITRHGQINRSSAPCGPRSQSRSLRSFAQHPRRATPIPRSRRWGSLHETTNARPVLAEVLGPERSRAESAPNKAHAEPRELT